MTYKPGIVKVWPGIVIPLRIRTKSMFNFLAFILKPILWDVVYKYFQLHTLFKVLVFVLTNFIPLTFLGGGLIFFPPYLEEI